VGQHSGPYPSQHPNKPEEEIDLEAALAYQKWRRGAPVEQVAEELGISRRTLYNRLDRLKADEGLPTRRLQRSVEFDRLEDLNRRVFERLDGDVSNQDFVKFVAEARQLSRERLALVKDDDEPPPKDPLSPEDEAILEDWEAAEDVS
jgi:DNA-binding transcriptional ArsR family regulator